MKEIIQGEKTLLPSVRQSRVKKQLQKLYLVFLRDSHPEPQYQRHVWRAVSICLR